MKRHYRSDQNAQFLLNITPETAQWKYISFKVARLGPSETIEADTAAEEVVIVPLVGRGKLLFNGQTHELARKDLFRELADIAYLPPAARTEFARVTRRWAFRSPLGLLHLLDLELIDTHHVIVLKRQLDGFVQSDVPRRSSIICLLGESGSSGQPQSHDQSKAHVALHDFSSLTSCSLARSA